VFEIKKAALPASGVAADGARGGNKR